VVYPPDWGSGLIQHFQVWRLISHLVPELKLKGFESVQQALEPGREQRLWEEQSSLHLLEMFALSRAVWMAELTLYVVW
jgi:hypothetical protein